MRKVVVINHLTLDGVMQAPGRPDEDRRGGFEHGGWAVPYGDEVMAATMAEGMSGLRTLLLGRRTYEDFFSYWPKQTDNPYTAALENARKYVASTTLQEPLPWRNSTLLAGDAAQAVSALKREPGDDIAILGSGELVRSLMRRGLIDEYRVSVYPLVLGSGGRMFAHDGPYTALQLVASKVTTTGVVMLTYRPA